MSHVSPTTIPNPLDPLKIRAALHDRRRRLATLPTRVRTHRIASLLSEVDAALERLDGGSWGECTRCHGRVESELLAADFTASVCLDCFTETERRALEHDLGLASRVQASLLPPRDFHVHGWSGHYVYRPHAVVSGDYVDVVSWHGSAGGSLVLLGDVSGKGIAAALLMSHLHAAFRSMATNGAGLSQTVEQVNRLLCAATASNAFATLVAARLQPDGTVELCSAGHTPTLLVTASGVEEISANGMPLGVFPDTTFTSHRLELEPGDALVLYSDGLTESTDPGGVELGVEGVRAALAAAPLDSPKGVVTALAAAAAHHRHDLAPTDDLTVMALSRTAD